MPAASLREAVLQTYLFAGFPRAINAFIALGEAGAHPSEVHVERSRSLDSWRRRGERLCRRIYARDFVPLMRRMRSLHPDFADWILVEGYGKTLSRPFLTPRQRELIVIPVLAALGAWRQVPSHVKGAWNCGARGGEVEGVLAGALGGRERARAAGVVRDLWKETRPRKRRV